MAYSELYEKMLPQPGAVCPAGPCGAKTAARKTKQEAAAEPKEKPPAAEAPGTAPKPAAGPGKKAEPVPEPEKE